MRVPAIAIVAFATAATLFGCRSDPSTVGTVPEISTTAPRRPQLSATVEVFDRSGRVQRTEIIPAADYDSLMLRIKAHRRREYLYQGDSTHNGIAVRLDVDSTGAGLVSAFSVTDSAREVALANTDSTVTDTLHDRYGNVTVLFHYSLSQLTNPYTVSCTQGYASCWQCFKWGLQVAAAYMSAAWVCGSDINGEVAKMACDLGTMMYEWKQAAWNALCNPGAG